MSACPTIAIIGGGFSGAMAAVHLCRTLPADHQIVLIERRGGFGRGAAYAETAAPHLLNVRSGNMSAWPDQPAHFDTWLATRPDAAGEIMLSDCGAFATRRLYGRYLRSLLYAAIQDSAGRVRLVFDEVTSLAQHGARYLLNCRSGREIDCSGVVLGLGNLSDSAPGCGVVFNDPWCDAATARLSADSPVLIIGTGLTMVDLVLGLEARGHQGPILAVSRRGLVPSAHKPIARPWTTPDFTETERRSLPALLRRVRNEVRQAASEGVNWRAVIDSLRPITATLWQGLPEAERRRFLRHLRPFWDIHRHRMAPSSADRLAALRRSGQLELRRGRLLDVSVANGQAQAKLRLRGEPTPQTVAVQRVIHATGIRPAGAQNSLIRSLIDQGLARIDTLGLGLAVSPDLALLGTDGKTSPGLWALGPIVHGTFWECTAVPDIRLQAQRLAERIAGGAGLKKGWAPPKPAKGRALGTHSFAQ